LRACPDWVPPARPDQQYGERARSADGASVASPDPLERVVRRLPVRASRPPPGTQPRPISRSRPWFVAHPVDDLPGRRPAFRTLMNQLSNPWVPGSRGPSPLP
jgi:hypothetical protein